MLIDLAAAREFEANGLRRRLVSQEVGELGRLPAAGWRYSLFASCCDDAGSTHIFTLWRAETKGKGQRYPFTGATPVIAIAAGFAWIAERSAQAATA